MVNNIDIKNAMQIRLDDVLPDYPDLLEGVRRAPRRETNLRKEEKALKSELFKLRFQHALNGLDNPKKMELVKKNIARVNTVITKKEKNI